MNPGLGTPRFPTSPLTAPCPPGWRRDSLACVGLSPGWLRSLVVQTEPVLPGSLSVSLTFRHPVLFHPKAGGRGVVFAGSSQEEVTSCGVLGPGWGRGSAVVCALN